MYSVLTLLFACAAPKTDSSEQNDTSYLEEQDTSSEHTDTGEADSGTPTDTGSSSDSGTTDTGNTTSDGDADGDGFTTEEGDCDDSDATIHPQAVEWPDDGIDHDCDNEDISLTPLSTPLSNAGFDIEDSTRPGKPQDWSNLGGSFAWQANNTNIFNVNGDTGALFGTHDQSDGALKIWGDYGANPLSPGESPVYQQFLGQTTDISSGVLWLDGWMMHHNTDPLQGEAKTKLVLRCFSEYMGTWSLLNEFSSLELTANSETDSWQRFFVQGTCSESATILQVMVLFTQTDSNTDHGAVFVDSLQIGFLP